MCPAPCGEHLQLHLSFQAQGCDNRVCRTACDQLSSRAESDLQSTDPGSSLSRLHSLLAPSGWRPRSQAKLCSSPNDQQAQSWNSHLHTGQNFPTEVTAPYRNIIRLWTNYYPNDTHVVAFAGGGGVWICFFEWPQKQLSSVFFNYVKKTTIATSDITKWFYSSPSRCWMVTPSLGRVCADLYSSLSALMHWCVGGYQGDTRYISTEWSPVAWFVGRPPCFSIRCAEIN